MIPRALMFKRTIACDGRSIPQSEDEFTAWAMKVRRDRVKQPILGILGILFFMSMGSVLSGIVMSIINTGLPISAKVGILGVIGAVVFGVAFAVIEEHWK